MRPRARFTVRSVEVCPRKGHVHDAKRQDSPTDGPPGIQTQQDVEAAIPPLIRKLAALEDGAGAFVIACFSDPGLHVVREITKTPTLDNRRF